MTLDDETISIVMSVALRFDGYRYLESRGLPVADFSSIVKPILATLELSNVYEENWTAFFALQRYLHKWGGDHLPVTSREWSCYLLLFLHLYERPLPEQFISDRTHTYDAAQISEAAGRVRSFLITSQKEIFDQKSFPRQYYDLEMYLLEVVRSRFHATGTLSAFDFFSIIIWKANRAKTRIARRMLRRYRSLEDATAALCVDLRAPDNDRGRLAALMDGWGFRLPMATAILTILWPDKFTVYDIRVCNQLQAFHDVGNKSNSSVWPAYQAYREAVMAAVPDVESLREKDRVLWSQNAIAQLQADISSGFGAGAVA